MIHVRDIQHAVADRYHVDRAIMTEPDGLGARSREKVQARQTAMFLCHELGKPHNDLHRFGFSNVGRLFGGRDHTTVMHACKAVEKRAGADRVFFLDLAELTDRFAEDAQ